MPADDGTFSIRNVKPGRHRLDVVMPDETWYLKAMMMTGVASSPDPRQGLTVKAGDQFAGVKFTIASGAAAFKGRVVTDVVLRSTAQQIWSQFSWGYFT